MSRHVSNANLHLHYDNTFEGLPIMEAKGPFIEQYLSRCKCTIERALECYSRVFAFRVDLRLPLWIELPEYVYTNLVIREFLKSFKAKIEHDRQRAQTRNRYAHDSDVHYVWTREVGSGERPHYHLLILLNADAYFRVGNKTSSKQNIFTRLQEAWAQALGLRADAVSGLVGIPPAAEYRLTRRPGDERALVDLFYRASYLCKAATKVYGDGQHGFGSSRR
ncbi:TPA: inovirus Gp2 family protein [Pseudomonas aeruginosa]|uniref:inovirus Gp2 family protein n=2 Tax=Pseudomonas aeruginosa TaxID=287 RepID=UPI000B491545|nr:inovirus Gp2 family protein [Pseudomonas aeruginosa]MDF3866710.1 inovirus Gp2 family protein [Pseudomonas denitrificans (nom. rej.)]EKU7417955.1 inovirus Gp2 family protein [Pseudomonas aeruginosa]MBF2891727.1 inovirus Gp2 family protein [Pseudomonas aeruginosa]MBF2923867.1 inovirus Gp2 family protein [Pseudomonas aeruginosa]MBF2938393.1 inovirus Gp2 family protein [Pseudomonas aeruginosa]